MRYAVIMAGGSGKRLWPSSRANHPKQVLKLVDGQSLVQIAVGRLSGLFEPEQILIVTNAMYADDLAAEVPNLPRENIIGEPMGRDTANAIALAAQILAGKDENGTMAVFTADHIIRPIDCFQKTVISAMESAEAHPNALTTFGVRPSWPHTGLGYIETGEKVGEQNARKVVEFIEKPDHSTARRFVESGRHFWNSGMFVWTLPAIRNALNQYLPDSIEKLAAIPDMVKNGESIDSLLQEKYPELEKISIDYAVMEKAAEVLMVELQCEWIDLGSWPALEEVLSPDEQGNVIVADDHLIMDSFRNVLVNQVENHLLAVLGVDELVVVHTQDVTLVCKKADSQRLKELVNTLEQHNDQKYL